MKMVDCAACDTAVPEHDTYFGTKGVVCSQCHAAEESADREEFHRANQEESGLEQVASLFEREVVLVDDDHQTAGFFGWLGRLFGSER